MNMAQSFGMKYLNYFISFLIRVLRAGNIPRHVAIIMDGNRRYAGKNNMNIENGHLAGFKKLEQVLAWSQELGITECTVFAFAIDNFKRTPNEVAHLMSLIKSAAKMWYRKRAQLEKDEVCVRAVGKLKLLPKDVQEAVAQLFYATRNNTKFRVNLAVAYSSHEEIYHAIQELSKGVQQGLIEPDDITEDVLQRCLYTSDSPDPDLLIRTSGETRLSDFLLWQTCYTPLLFVKQAWPEFSFWNLFSCIFYFQRTFDKVKEYKEKAARTKQMIEDELLRKKAMNKKRIGVEMEDNIYGPCEFTITESETIQCRQERDERLKKFYVHLQDKNEEFWKSMLNAKIDNSIRDNQLSDN